MRSLKRSRRTKHPVSAEYVGGGLLSFTGELINSLVSVVVRAIDIVSQGAEIAVDSAGSTAQAMGDDILKVHTTQIFRNVGKTVQNISEGLGKVVGVIPLLGGPTAYVVERAGDGVNYVVVGVGDVLGEAVARVGKATHDASNIVVFTLAKAHTAVDEAADAVKAYVVQDTTEDTSKDTSKGSGGRGTRRTKRSRRRRKR